MSVSLLPEMTSPFILLLPPISSRYDCVALSVSIASNLASHKIKFYCSYQACKHFMFNEDNDKLCFCAAHIFQAIQGHWLSASLGVIMKLRVPEILSEAQGPLGFEEVTYLSS